MKQVPFTKFTVNGNNFVLLDESKAQLLTESQKAEFAFFATDMNFGIGADNLLIIQPASWKTLREINDYRNYWEQMPGFYNAELIFRMLEPDGLEALCCGNGLLCAAKHLFESYNRKSVQVVAGIPNTVFNHLKIGTESKTSTNWVQFFSQPPSGPDCPALLDDGQAAGTPQRFEFPITFERNSDLVLLTRISPFVLKGYYVGFGEPHLIFFSSDNRLPEDFSEAVFPEKSVVDKRKEINEPYTRSRDLFQSLGMYFKTNFREQFPGGININFVHSRVLSEERVIEYRTFERGIFKETLACGTGALAIALTAFFLGLIDRNEIQARPYWSGKNKSGNCMRIQKLGPSFLYSGRPSLLFQGSCSHVRS